MELGSKNLRIAIRFIEKTTNALSLKCMMEFDDIVKTFGSKLGYKYDRSKTREYRLLIRTRVRITSNK